MGTIVTCDAVDAVKYSLENLTKYITCDTINTIPIWGEPISGVSDITTNKNKEENKMIDLLERYREKQTAKLREDYGDKRNAILQYDPDFTILSRLATERCEYPEHVKEYVRIDIDSFRSNMESVNKDLNRLEFEVEDDIIKLDEKIKDIEAVLELATTFEQKRDILVSYGVLNCDGTLAE